MTDYKVGDLIKFIGCYWVDCDKVGLITEHDQGRAHAYAVCFQGEVKWSRYNFGGSFDARGYEIELLYRVKT